MAGLITKFIEDNPEDGDHNQYWYSESTIAAIIRDQVDQYEIAGSPAGGLTIAFLSTPSLYYSLPEALRQNSYLFDFDGGPNGIWLSDRGYVAYDFNHPSTGIPSHLLGKVDMVIIDPPFIVEEVWAQYVIPSKLLLKEGNDLNGVPHASPDDEGVVQAELEEMTIFGNGEGVAEDNDLNLVLDPTTDWHQLAHAYQMHNDVNPLLPDGVERVWDTMPDVDGAPPRTVLRSQLKEEQRHAYDMIMKLANSPPGIKNGDRRIIITGSAGAGKSFVLDAVRHGLGAKHVLVCAYSAKAAANVMGRTIHGQFHILPGLFRDLQGSKLEEFQSALKDIKLIVIDEYTMVDGELLSMIDARCKAGCRPSHNHLDFGGIALAIVGDPQQIPPIAPKVSIWTKGPGGPAGAAGRKTIAGHNLYMGTKHCVVLPGSQRLQQDAPDYEVFKGILDELAKDGKLSPANVVSLTSRCSQQYLVRTLGEEEFNKRFASEGTVGYFQTNEDRMKYNLARMLELNMPLFCCKRRKVSGTGQSDCTAIPQNFWGCVGAIVACTANINQGVGILNGSMGVIRDVIYAAGENGIDHLPTGIVVEFEDYRGPRFFAEDGRDTWVVLPRRQQRSNDEQCTVEGFPLQLAFGCTAHKAQGQTNKCGAIVELGTKEYSLGATYVMLSRVTEMRRLMLKSTPTQDRFAKPLSDPLKKRKIEPKMLSSTLPEYVCRALQLEK